MAVAHSILVAAWHILANDADYDDLGGDWVWTIRRAVRWIMARRGRACFGEMRLTEAV